MGRAATAQGATGAANPGRAVRLAHPGRPGRRRGGACRQVGRSRRHVSSRLGRRCRRPRQHVRLEPGRSGEAVCGTPGREHQAIRPVARGHRPLAARRDHRPHAASELQDSQKIVTGAALALFRAMAEVPAHPGVAARIWLVSRNAIPALPADPPVEVAAGGLWGLGRSAALEHPRNWGGLVDLNRPDNLRPPTMPLRCCRRC